MKIRINGIIYDGFEDPFTLIFEDGDEKYISESISFGSPTIVFPQSTGLYEMAFHTGIERVKFVSFSNDKPGVYSYTFESEFYSYVVNIQYDLLKSHETLIFRSGRLLIGYSDNRFIFPKEAFYLSGIDVFIGVGDCPMSGLPKEFCWHCKQEKIEDGINDERTDH